MQVGYSRTAKEKHGKMHIVLSGGRARCGLLLENETIVDLMKHPNEKPQICNMCLLNLQRDNCRKKEATILQV